MLLTIGAVVAVILLALLYHYIPSRKVFFCFFVVLCLASAVVFFAWPSTRHHAENTMSPEERYALMEQQQTFADWYESYQKDIDSLDHNWQWYHQILENFKEDNISIQTTYLRLSQLEQDSQQLADRIEKHTPPLSLSDSCYDEATEVVRKTHEYAEAQHRAIALTRAAADPANLRSDDQEEQSRQLQAVMIRESPAGLFVADEIAAIRSYLALPDEQDGATHTQEENPS